MEQTTGTYRDYHAYTLEVLRSLEEDWKGKPGAIYFERLLNDCVIELLRQTPHTFADPREDDAFTDKLYYLRAVMEELPLVTTEWKDMDAGKLKGWHHVSTIIPWGPKKSNPHIDSDNLYRSVEQYLRSGLHLSYLDRLFVELLVAKELFAYINHPRIFIRTGGGALWSFLWGRVTSAAIFAGLTWIASRWSEEAAGIVGLIGFILWLVEAGFAAAAVLGFRKSSPLQKHRELFEAMQSVYHELDPRGSVSTAHISERVKASSAAGVVWPGPLFVLLEDIAARRQSF